ncbi:MAG TPA: hypothetical protein VGG82_07845 [Casimicrobiaceae bacterium]|jgi:hypothetical protein
MNGDTIKVLRAEIAERKRELARYERALALLEGEPSAPANGSSAPAPARKRAKPSKLGEERMAKVEAAIHEFAKDHDEFRQVDIRTVIDVTSGTTAMAFEQLRQAGTIRLARKDGNNKWYRLTEATRRENDGE